MPLGSQNMHITMADTFLALMFFEVSRTANSTCAAGVVLFLIGFSATKSAVARASGLDKVVALSNLCFAIPLAVFGAEHFSAATGISQIVPKFMPWPLFWTYFVGTGLVAAALSIATRIHVRWSGFLFGLMMFLFVAMMDLPGTLADVHNRISWALMFREMAFGSGGWMLAAAAMDGPEEQRRWRALIPFGRTVIGIACLLYGVEHFLHPLGLPGVPLEKEMPAWIPARMLIDYLTGIFLLAGGVCFLLNRKARMAAAYLGGWILSMVLVIYGPVLIMALADPSTSVKVEGINYFFDTLLFAGTVLALASAIPRVE